MKQNARIEEINKSLVTARGRYNAAVKEINANENLSGHGKENLIKEEQKKFNLQRDTLRAELREATDNERGRLERAAFAAPKGQEDSYRNTLARLSAITDRSQREKALQLAVKTGDTVSLRALAAISHSGNEGKGWQTIASVAEHDRDVSALVEFEKTYGELRSGEEKLWQNVESFAHGRPVGFRPSHGNSEITVDG